MKKKRSYVIWLPKEGPSHQVVAGALVIFGWSVCALIGLKLTDQTVGALVYAALILLALVCACVWIREVRRERKPEKTICVTGETFRIGYYGERGTTYRFSDITRVRAYSPLIPRARGYSIGERCWAIYVGSTVVAVLTMEMENAWRFLEKTGELGLITPYGTGIKP